MKREGEAGMADAIEVYLEVGKKRTFAGPIEWPGWCRPGKDEASALAALVETGPRYARAVEAAGLGFRAPADAAGFMVVERLTGTATTDFGAPDVAPASDARPFDDAAFRRSRALLEAIWRAFDVATEGARGKELRKGPRGGGRELEGIVEHVLGADRNYLGRLAWKAPKDEGDDLRARLDRLRAAMVEALAAAARGELPERGPRGGEVWAPRYFVRRVAWHALDHLWEIEDRAGAS
jgi:hypothetical protein